MGDMGEKGSSLVHSPDETFLDAFDLATVETVTPVKQTPWCGNLNASDFRQLTSNGWGPRTPTEESKTTLNESFDAVYDAGRPRNKPPYTIVKVITETETAYVFDFHITTEHEQTWFNERVEAYKYALRLGAHVPTVVFGDSWWAIKHFDGERFQEALHYIKDASSEKEQAILKQLCLDLARLTIIGHGELGTPSLLIRPDGEFRHGTMHTAGHRLTDAPFRYIVNMKRVFSTGKRPGNWWFTYEDIVTTLAKMLHEPSTDTAIRSIDETPTITQNIEAVMDLFPLKRDSVDGPYVPTAPVEQWVPPRQETNRLLMKIDRRAVP